MNNLFNAEFKKYTLNTSAPLEVNKLKQKRQTPAQTHKSSAG